MVDGAPDAHLAFAPDGIELDPGRGDVDGAEGVEVEALGAAATVGDEIDLHEARARIVPVGEGADGDLVLEEGAGAGGGGPAERALGAGGRQQPGEGVSRAPPGGRSG